MTGLPFSARNFTVFPSCATAETSGTSAPMASSGEAPPPTTAAAVEEPAEAGATGSAEALGGGGFDPSEARWQLEPNRATPNSKDARMWRNASTAGSPDTALFISN